MRRNILFLILFLIIQLTPFPITYAQNISVPEIFQEQSQWCWAACSQATLRYYGTNIAQCTIADFARDNNGWGNDDCCVSPSNSICNQPNFMWGTSGSFQAILQNWGVNSNILNRELNLTEINSEISAGRPFEIRWGWDGGGGHFIVGRGISGNNISYMDPGPGNGYATAIYNWMVSGGGHTWTSTLQLTTAPSSGVDIALIIDKSGSMGTSNYMEPAKTAAGTFVGFMQNGDNVGVVSFNAASTVNFPLTEITSEAVKTSAINEINKISSGGGTSIGAGIETGQGELDKSNRDIQQAQVLLSDGKETASPNVAEILPTIPDKTDIYTIALGSESDENLLQHIANQTDGTYNYAPNSADLQELYLFIRSRVTGEQGMGSFRGMITQGARIIYDLFIDALTRHVTFSVIFEGSDVDLELLTPNGQIITPSNVNNFSNVTYSEGTTYDFYNISYPQAGKWTLYVTGVDIPTPEQYTASVFGSSDLIMDTYFGKNFYSAGEQILIKARLTENNQPITGSSVIATVTPPSTSFITRDHSNRSDKPSVESSKALKWKNKILSASVQVNLFDDGQHGDGAANDGVYANYFSDTSIDGSYNFRVEASGTASIGGSFNRVDILSIFVGPATWPTEIKVTEPNGGEAWNVGQEYAIKWTADKYTGKVRIDISTTGGNTWWDVTQGSFTANDGHYSYTPVPENVSENCYFKVVSVDNPNAQDRSNQVFSIRGITPPAQYTAYKIPDNIAVPTIDGIFNEQIWNNAPEDSLLFGGIPDQYNETWSNWNDNLVIWKALWSKVTNKLYLSATIRDDIRGVFDDNNPNASQFYPFNDDCLTIFTDGDHSGGYYEGNCTEAQQWWLTGENKIVLDDYPSSSNRQFYTGSAIKSAITVGINGNWTFEAELEIYNSLHTNRKVLAVGEIIGWNVWYNDSDNETRENNKYIRDHQTGWLYSGPAYTNADYFGDLIIGSTLDIPQISVLSPNGGETINCNWNITWSSQNAGSNVKIEYFCNSAWLPVTNYTPNDGSFLWTIPQNTVCNLAKIRITDLTNSTTADESDNYFSIDCGGNEPCQPPYLKAEDVSAMQGNIVIPISIKNNPSAIDAMGFKLTYCSDKLTYVETQRGDLTGSFSFFQATLSAPGLLTIGGFNTTAIPVNSTGSVAKVVLHINQCQTGDQCELGLQDLVDDFIGLNACNGTFTCEQGCLLGDVNMDNAITTGDALCAFQIYMNSGIPPSGSCDNECALYAADANCDGNVTSGDALVIFSAYLNGLTAPLDCPPKSGLTKSPVIRKLSLNPLSGIPGQEIQVPLYIKNPENLQAFSCDLGYPKDMLEFVGVATSNLTRDWKALEGQENVAGVITLGGFSAEPVTEQAAGELLKITFRIKENAAGTGDLWLFQLGDDFLKGESISGEISVISSDLRMLSSGALPTDYKLEQNFPNPFNLQTEIIYSIPEEGHIRLTIYNSIGQRIKTLISMNLPAGRFAAAWNGLTEDGLEVPSGIYIYRIESAKFNDVKKMLLIK